MRLSLIRGRWVAFGAVLLLGLLLVACGSTTPASAPNSPSEPKAQAEKSESGVTSEQQKLSADNPVVVLPPDKDLERRKELAALLPSSTESNAGSAAPSAKADAPASADQSEQKEKDATAPENQQPKDSVAAPAVENPVAEAPEPTPERFYGGKVGNLGAEFRGIVAWINSEPLSLADLRGKVVLVDVWTYTCINCIRTMPFLKQWYSKYQDDGLVIVGVHSPEFEFEKELDNVVQATEDYSISWPVALDNNFITWRGYNNRFWPSKYLIDKDGVVRYTHFGEGQYAETEEKIRELLMEAGADLSQEFSALPVDPTIDPTYRSNRNAEVTRELYAGYERGRSDVLYGRGGYVLQRDYYKDVDSVIRLEAPDVLEPHVLYFNGDWKIGAESAEHGRESMDYEDYFSMIYSARSVNAVMTWDSGEAYKVRVTVDGKYLTADNKGTDVTIGEDGESYLLVTGPRLYNVLDNPSYVRRETLKMASDSPDFGLFAFTFGVYKKAG
jgi:thiol-disulfide isomerase/thioredoxin